jgi:hypothetical protein
MIPFFRKIRKKLADDNKFLKYSRYAIGEIVLVVIGILIALSINNWNENRKSIIMANELYTNLLTSLEQDSIEVQRIIYFLSKSLEAQKKLILSESDQFTNGFNQNDLEKMVREINRGVLSFFPKTGVYDLITSNNSMDLLHSKKIKQLLINLYDFQYKRYENVDAIIDHKFHFQLHPLIQKKIGFLEEVNSELEVIVIKPLDPILFNEHYKELVSECQGIYLILSAGEKDLFMIRESINELTPLIRKELKK